MTYRKKIHREVTDTCPLCHIGAHIIHHTMEECPSLDPLRHTLTPPLCTDDLWDRPGPCVAFLRSSIRSSSGVCSIRADWRATHQQKFTRQGKWLDSVHTDS